MSQSTVDTAWDPVAVRALGSSDGSIDEFEFERLIERDVAPICARVLRHRFGAFPGRGPTVKLSVEEDMADLQGESVRLVIKKLRGIVAGDGEAVQDLGAYVARTAHRVFDEYLRRKSPVRSAISNKLRYLLRNREGLDLWTDSEGRLLAGFDQWRKSKSQVRFLARERAERDAKSMHSELTSAGDDPDDLQTLVNWLLSVNGGPATLGDLIATVALVRGTVDTEPVAREDLAGGSLDESLSSGEAGAEELSQLRLELDNLWREICQLPLNQRYAILLNLRDGRGKGIVALLPILGICTLDQISKALEIELDELRSFWDDLPYDDASIADRIGVTPAQVIGLRRAGRARLQRRLEEKN